MRPKIYLFQPVILLFLFTAAVYADDTVSSSDAQEIKEEAPFRYSRDRWIEMRKDLEEGRQPGEKVLKSTATPKMELPPPAPGAVIQLPYQATLSINGRKRIGVNMQVSAYPNADDDRKNPQSSFQMQQELQVRIKGGVGKKVNVNIDFDDTQPDRRNISVSYTGDPDDLVQEAAFGDINLSLPNAEFIGGYGKQAFGAKVRLNKKFNKENTKNINASVVWSQSKGNFDSDRFTGDQKMQPKSIQDIGYIKRKYYKIVFGTDTIKPGTVEVYRDDRNPYNNSNTRDILVTNNTDYAVIPSTYFYRGSFDLLKPNEDYVVDPYNGFIRFTYSLSPDNCVIAVNYQKADGGTLMGTLGNSTFYLLLKDETNIDGVTRELKNYYSLDQTNIVEDDGRGSFILQLIDANNNIKNDLIKYDRDKDVSDIIVNFIDGFFYTKKERPFSDSKVYQSNPISSGFSFRVEFRYSKKVFNLKHPFIIPQSERVVINGSQALERDRDYFMDYDSGILTFIDSSKILQNTIIDVSYEWSITGIQTSETFVGGRVETNLKNFHFGASAMGNNQPTKTNVPDLKSVPQSKFIVEYDGRLSGVSLKPLPLSMNVSFARAQSSMNQNVQGVAMIDSMEGIQQEDSRIFEDRSWRYITTPSGDWVYPDSVTWIHFDEPANEVNPKGSYQAGEKLRVLKINYDLTSGLSNEISIGQVISSVGNDYHKKLYMELWVYGDGKNENLRVEMGKFSEDVDQNNMLDTEDTVLRNGVLDTGEDVGWNWTDPRGVYPAKKIGASNGYLDSEDLNGNGVLDTLEEVNGSYKLSDGWSGVDPNNPASTTTYHSVNWTGWRIFTVPLNITDANSNKWIYTKQMRVTVRAPGQKGEIRIGRISVVGNKWENLSPNNLEISALNNKNSPYYANNSLLTLPADSNEYRQYQKLTSDTGLLVTETKQEQALSLKYNINSSTTTEASIRTLYPSAQDISGHRKFRFFLFGDGNGEEFFIRVGADDNNYFEYRTTVSWNKTWKLITIDQADLNRDDTPDRWYPPENCSMTGNPLFTNIQMIKFGVRGAGTVSGEIWVNEIHVDEPFDRVGTAQKYNADFSVPKWMSFGGGYTQSDNKFETFTQSIRNQDSTGKTAFVNFSRISFMPLSVNYSDNQTVTPAALRSGELVSLIHEGTVKTTSLSGTAGFNYGNLPRLSFTYSVSTTSINNPDQKIFRSDINESRSGSASYSFPRVFSKLGLSFFDSFLPANVTASGSQSFTTVEPWAVTVSTVSQGIGMSTTTTVDASTNYSLQTSFQFWKFLSFNPSFNKSFTDGEEKNSQFQSTRGPYRKAESQSVNFNSTLNLLKWLSPTFSYNISDSENYNFPRSDRKSIVRTGSSRVSLGSVSANSVFPKVRYIKTLNLSCDYSVDSGENYNNVESTYNASGILWIQNRLAPQSPSAIRTSLSDRYTLNASARWNIFEGLKLKGRLEPLNDLTASANFSDQRALTENLGTKTTTYSQTWPDVRIGINRYEKFFGADNLISASQLNFSKTQRLNGTDGVSSAKDITSSLSTNFSVLKVYTISLSQSGAYGESFDYRLAKMTSQRETSSYSMQFGFDYKKKHYTPNYSYSSSKAWDGDRKYMSDGSTKIVQDSRSQSAGISFYWDTSFPEGLKIPILDKTLQLKNRITFNSAFSYSRTESDINIESTNTDAFNLTFSSNYEISKNFTAAVNGGYRQTINRVQNKNNNWAFNLGGDVSFIF